MKWFFQWLGNKIENCATDSNDTEPMVASNRPRKYRHRTNVISAGPSIEEMFSSEPITFKMYKASGGWAIEFRQYDSKTDRFDTSLYVVNDAEELGNHISQIITMEALKR